MQRVAIVYGYQHQSLDQYLRSLGAENVVRESLVSPGFSLYNDLLNRGANEHLYLTPLPSPFGISTFVAPGDSPDVVLVRELPPDISGLLGAPAGVVPDPGGAFLSLLLLAVAVLGTGRRITRGCVRV